MSAINPNHFVQNGFTTGGGESLDAQCPFNIGELDLFFNTDDTETIPGYQFISRRRLINVLNKITEESQGKNLLKVLKATLDKKNKDKKLDNKDKKQKISFITFCGDEDLKEFNDDYAFNSEISLSSGSIVISIKDSPPKSITRFAFDGQKIVERHVDDIDPEVYYISHELVHVVSFLEAGITDNIAWQRRKNDWESFLTTGRMAPTQEVLLAERQTIYSYFEKFFINTEEARNLLGFITENETLIGEFCFFNEKNNFFLPTYLYKISTLDPTEINFLRKIGKSLGIQFQVQNSLCTLL